MGLERELVRKEAGIRTGMMVSAGAAIFSIVALELPYIVAGNGADPSQIVVGNGGYLNIIANIVIGIGFLGAGIIIKTQEHVHGLTTAAVIWATAAIGVLAGLGLFTFAIATAIILFLALLITIRASVHSDNGS